jgi:Ca2+:H+ antiporter
MSRTELKQLIGVTDIVRVALGWGAFAALLLLHPVLAPPVPGPVLVIALLGIIAVSAHSAW